MLEQWQNDVSLAEYFPHWHRSWSIENNKVLAQFEKLRASSEMMFSGESCYLIRRNIDANNLVTQDGNHYISESNVRLDPDECLNLYTTHSYLFNSTELEKEQNFIDLVFQSPETFSQLLRKPLAELPGERP